MANNNVFKYDYVLLFHENDADAARLYDEELSRMGYNGCLYDDPTAALDIHHYIMQKIEYLLQHSRVCLLYTTESVCNMIERKLQHVVYTALEKCLADKSNRKKLKPVYPETKAALERKGHTLDSLGAISGLERQSSYYDQHLRQAFSSSCLAMDEQNALGEEKNLPLSWMGPALLGFLGFLTIMGIQVLKSS